MGNSPSQPPAPAPAPSTAPYNAQLDQIQLQLSCQYNGSAAIINTTFAATAPLIAGSAVLSDIAATLGLPFTNDTIVASNISLAVSTTNSTPSTASTTAAAAINGSTISLPAGNPVLPLALGPFQLNGNTQYSLSAVNYTLLHQSGVLDSYACNVTQNIIGTIVSDNTTALQAPSNGAPAVFPATGTGNRATVANLPLNCVVDNGQSLRPVPYNISVTTVSSATSIRAFNVPQWVALLTVPGSEVDTILNTTGSNSSQIGFLVSNGSPVTLYGYDFSNASVSRFDSHDGFLAQSNSIISNYTQAYYKTFRGPLTISFSAEDGFTAGSFAVGDGRDGKASLYLAALLSGGGKMEEFACISTPL